MIKSKYLCRNTIILLTALIWNHYGFATPDIKTKEQQTAALDQATSDNQHIHVKRYGPGYDISFDLDATDENLSLMLDLPQQKDLEELKKSIFSSMEYMLKAQALFYQKKYTEAQQNIKQSIKQYSQNYLAHALAGSIYFKLEQSKKAIAAWKKALEINEELDDIKHILKKIGAHNAK